MRALLAFALFVVACHSKKGTGDAGSRQALDDSGDLAGGEQEAPVLASAIVREFSSNALSAEAKYTGKTALVLGVVAAVQRSDDGLAQLKMEGSTTSTALVCALDKDSEPIARELLRGNLVLVTATFRSWKAETVKADQCQIHWNSPSDGSTKMTRAEADQLVLSYLACALRVGTEEGGLPPGTGDGRLRGVMATTPGPRAPGLFLDGGLPGPRMKALMAKPGFGAKVEAERDADKIGVRLLPCSGSLIAQVLACQSIYETHARTPECDR
jgi:hypothetical protein